MDIQDINRKVIEQFRAGGDRVLVMASNAGAPKPPNWYANLVANQSVTVEIGDESYSATATVWRENRTAHELRRKYFKETVGRLRTLGHEVHHFSLLARRGTVLKRLREPEHIRFD